MPFTIRAQAIIPGALKVNKVRAEVRKALTAEGKHDAKILSKTVSSWRGEKPDLTAFHVGWAGSKGEAFVWIGPTGSDSAIAKWIRLDEGSPAHGITARNAPFMQFPFQGAGSSYTAATRPRWFGSGQSRKHGPIVKRKHVSHPGNEPREWSIVLGKQRIGPFANNIQAAVNRGLE